LLAGKATSAWAARLLMKFAAPIGQPSNNTNLIIKN
jgi:hypothetical protein